MQKDLPRAFETKFSTVKRHVIHVLPVDLRNELILPDALVGMVAPATSSTARRSQSASGFFRKIKASDEDLPECLRDRRRETLFIDGGKLETLIDRVHYMRPNFISPKYAGY